MDFLGVLSLSPQVKKKKVIVGEAGVQPHIGERIYYFRGKPYNVEKELRDEDLDLLNKNKNIKLTSVMFGRKTRISKYVTEGNAHIIFYYRGKQKSIKNILKNIPGTIEVKEDLLKGRKTYWIYGRAGSQTWFHNAAVTLSKLT